MVERGPKGLWYNTYNTEATNFITGSKRLDSAEIHGLDGEKSAQAE